MTLQAALFAAAPFILALLAVSAVFSAAETALTRASRGRMHQLERDGDRAAGRVNQLLSDQETMIGAVLIGYNVLNILSSALATEFITQVVPGAWGVAIATGLMTVLVVRLLGPIIYSIQWIVRHTLRIFGVRLEMEADVLAAHEEIRGAVEYHHSEGLVESGDRRMLGGVLDLGELTVADVMVHRRQIFMLEIGLPSAEIVTEALKSPYTRLPLYRGEQENVVGVLHAKDLARAIAAAGGPDKLDIAAIATEPWFVPETTHLKDQLNIFLKRRAHFALVVDEYGALQGLVTLEDILEEIVGEIEDEHDAAIEGVRLQPDGSVIVDGDVAVRELNRALDWDLPDEHAVSIAGLVIHEAQTIPDVGQAFIFYNHRFQVLRRHRNQITSLRVSPLPPVAEV